MFVKVVELVTDNWPAICNISFLYLENETKAAPSSSSTVWSSFNIIFDAPAAKPATVSVPSSQEEEPRSRDEEQKKNRDGTLLKKKKILRKVASSKVNEKNTITKYVPGQGLRGDFNELHITR